MQEPTSRTRAMRVWRGLILSGQHWGGLGGVLLVLATIVMMLAGVFLTYQFALRHHQLANALGIQIRGTAGAFILGLPSVCAGLIGFYVMSPTFFALVKNKDRYLGPDPLRGQNRRCTPTQRRRSR